jgi:predicted ATPase
MLTRIQLENFKCWRELDLKLAPITVLFGKNSSGKSSILQSLLFLQQSIEKDTVNFGGVNDNVNLGSYIDVVFGHDESYPVKIKLEQSNANQNFEFEMSYETQYGTVSWVEKHKSSDVLFNGLPSNGFQYIASLRQYPLRAYLWSGVMPKHIEANGENTIAAIVGDERAGGQLPIQVSEWLKQLELVDRFTTKALDSEKRFYETKVQIGDVESSILDVGFGISQVLPVITTLFFVPEGSIVLLEQPELHLHPSAQEHLADLFLHVAKERNLQLIVESHSEHLLRRLQRRIAEVESPFATPENIRMYFCQKGDNGSTIEQVKVDTFGQVLNWPDNFFGDITGDLEAMTFAALQRSQNGH